MEDYGMEQKEQGKEFTTRQLILIMFIAFLGIAFCVWFVWAQLPDASSPQEERMEYSHQINGIYADTAQEEHISGWALLVGVAGAGQADKSTKNIKEYCVWEKKDNEGFQLETYEASGNDFYFYKIGDEDSPRVEKWKIGQRRNDGNYDTKFEYRVYLNDEAMQDDWQLQVG